MIALRFRKLSVYGKLNSVIKRGREMVYNIRGLHERWLSTLLQASQGLQYTIPTVNIVNWDHLNHVIEHFCLY